VTGDLQGLLLTLVGVVTIRLAVTGAYLWYLKEAMRGPLVAAGTVLVVLGLATILRSFRRGSAAPEPNAPADDHHGHHDHGSGAPRVAWLLVLPVLAILLVAPAPLGAYAASRESTRTALAVPDAEPIFDALPPASRGAVPMSLSEFLTRSYYDEDDSLAGATVRLVGFVVADPELPDGFQLTRFTLACCAADAFPMRVAIHGVDGPIPANDTWVEATGTWIEPPEGTPTGVDRGASLQLASSTIIEQPTNPYEE
jgi:uncharacterized repeat protein (TIGR03943 family)